VAIRKPNKLLFSEFIERMGCKANEVIYVGDRLDKDIAPAKAIGIISILIHRGTKYDPNLNKQYNEIKPDHNINSLYELFNIIQNINEKQP
jgi:putative hydrolase of the HAD superfamily